MLIFLVVILVIVGVLILFWMIFLYSFTLGLVNTFLRGEAPFVPTKAHHLSKIAENMNLDEKSVLYDLGCGDARILVACHNLEPRAKYIGFETDILPYFWSKFRLRVMGIASKISIYKKDFLSQDLSPATHVYLYLGPNQMKKLAPALEREIEKGKKIVSLQFEIPDRVARKKISLGKDNLYVYEK